MTSPFLSAVPTTSGTGPVEYDKPPGVSHVPSRVIGALVKADYQARLRAGRVARAACAPPPGYYPVERPSYRGLPLAGNTFTADNGERRALAWLSWNTKGRKPLKDWCEVSLVCLTCSTIPVEFTPKYRRAFGGLLHQARLVSIPADMAGQEWQMTPVSKRAVHDWVVQVSTVDPWVGAVRDDGGARCATMFVERWPIQGSTIPHISGAALEMMPRWFGSPGYADVIEPEREKIIQRRATGDFAL